MGTFAGHARFEIAIANRSAVRPDFVDVPQRRQPGLGQAAELPGLHEHPASLRGWIERRRPAMPHVDLGRPSLRSASESGRQPRVVGEPIRRPHAVSFRPREQSQVVPSIQQLPAERAVDQRQRMQALLVPFPDHPHRSAPRRPLRTRGGERRLLAEKRDFGSPDVDNRVRQPQSLDRLAHLDPRDRTVEVVPDQPTARLDGLVSPASVVERVLQVMATVDEDEIQGRQPAEIISHRVGDNEVRLVGLAELIGVPAELGRTEPRYPAQPLHGPPCLARCPG